MDVEQAKLSPVARDHEIDAPTQLVAGGGPETKRLVVALHHLVEPSPAHREPVVDVVVARVVAPGEEELIVAGRKDALGGVRSVHLLECNDVGVEDASVAGECPVVLVAAHDRTPPQRAAGPPVQQVEIPGRNPDPFGRCRRTQGRRRAGTDRRSFGTVGLFAGGRRRSPAGILRELARAAGPARARPVAMARAARPVVVATVRGQPARMRGGERRRKQHTRQARKETQGRDATSPPCPPSRRSNHAAGAAECPRPRFLDDETSETQRCTGEASTRRPGGCRFASGAVHVSRVAGVTPSPPRPPPR